MMGRYMSGDTNWREERRAAFEAHAASLARQKAAENQRAQAMIDDFVSRMAATVPAHPLRAQVAGRGGTYRTRTHLTGWYIRRNHALAVGAGGEFYILDVPASLRSRVFGVDMAPADPPLVVGEGARDGESIPLEELLEQRLTAGSGFP